MAHHVQSRPKKKWNTGVLLLTIYLFLTGLIALSIASFIQTEIAFREVNDANITLFKLPLGLYMSVFFAFIFQYGQGAILYIRKELLSSKTLFRFGISWSQKTLAMLAFIVFATVDAGTNVLWLYQVYTAPEDKIKAFLVQAVLYSAMVLSVFAEEILGTVLDARARVQSEFNYILEQEEKEKTKKKDKSPQKSYQYKKPQPQQQGKKKSSHQRSAQKPSRNSQRVETEEFAGSFMEQEGFTMMKR